MKVGIVSKHHYLEYTDKYLDMEYVVLFNFGGYRTAYVNVKNTFLENLAYMECDNYADAHGGFTYKDCRLPFELSDNENYVWLGWDYAHFCDGCDLISLEKYFGKTDYLKMKSLSISSGLAYNNHIYTLLDVMRECKEVIIQIQKGGANDSTNKN